MSKIHGKYDPLNPNGAFKDLLRQDVAATDPKEIDRRRQTQAACKSMLKGFGRDDLYRELWKEAELRKRAFITFESMTDLLGWPYHFHLLTGKKAKTGLLSGVGHYMDAFPKQLLAEYERACELTQQMYPSRVAILVFKLPFLKSTMGVLREGEIAGVKTGTSRLVYSTEHVDYILQSAYAFGIDHTDTL